MIWYANKVLWYDAYACHHETQITHHGGIMHTHTQCAVTMQCAARYVIDIVIHTSHGYHVVTMEARTACESIVYGSHDRLWIRGACQSVRTSRTRPDGRGIVHTISFSGCEFVGSFRVPDEYPSSTPRVGY